MEYLKLASFAFLLATGQILFKKAALSGVSGGDNLMAFVNGWTITALTLYGAATILWIYILRTTPLSVAYPFVALAFVIVPACAWLFYNEAIGLRYFLGSGLIVSGIVITSLGETV